MKALMDCKWKVNIYGVTVWFWCATILDDSGLEYISLSSKDCETSEAAKNNWIKFADVNGITNYKFVEE